MSLRELVCAAGEAIDTLADRVVAIVDGVVAIAGVVARALWWQTSPEFKLKAIAFLLGIPLSYAGYLWMAYKPVKQVADCHADLYSGFGAETVGTPQGQFDATMQADLALYLACHGNVDPRISSADFLQQQHARWRDGKP